MKIIKTGTGTTRKCKCGCIFEYEVKDIHSIKGIYGENNCVYCPECGDKILLNDTSKYVNESDLK